MAPARSLVVGVALCALILVVAPPAQAVPGLYADLKAAGFNKFAELVGSCANMMSALSESSNPDWKCTILAPSDEAVTAWLKEMNMDLADFRRRPLLASMVAGYHMLLQEALSMSEITSKPTVVNTGCPVYNITLTKNAKGAVTATDAQSRVATVSTKGSSNKGKLIYGIDKLLMNGDFFFKIEDALKFHSKKLSDVSTAISRVPALRDAAGKASTEVTLLAPMNAGFQAAKINAANVPAATLEKVLLFHVLTGVKALPWNITAGTKYSTMLSGASLSFDFTSPKEVPVVRGSPYKMLSATAYVVPPKGSKVMVVAPNCFAGKSVIHIIKDVLTPPASLTAIEAAPAAKGLRLRRLLSHARSLLQGQGVRQDRGYRSQLSLQATSARILAATQGGSVRAATASGLANSQLVSYTSNSDLFLE